ncbi:MAG TPA: pyridoxamine 5'-phosphate oxidase, partial [Burkholderiales bacterium]|nr:pyridoxamine 5'-phosphate oxidase [Burkholderiales bacterium]
HVELEMQIAGSHIPQASLREVACEAARGHGPTCPAARRHRILGTPTQSGSNVTNPQDQRGARREYLAEELRRASLAQDPFEQFGKWFGEACALDLLDATAMALATATGKGTPSVRIVLMKQYDVRGFCWYSDARSRKGAELERNPRASLLFHWRELSRQVRISGVVERLPDEVARTYFATRPRASQLAAAASHQSAPVADRETLMRRVETIDTAAAGAEIAKPDSWSAYRLAGSEFEFWQGREGRLHDRFRYSRHTDGSWQIERLQP